ncbi:nuclear transport factor 2 family protein [Streptomyces sp. NPDC058464]|uniref:nuclear transport factor 2 family protein n=1 Tax=Streptomyces sp. NPDC058464 TaxID=3346511 RepID=UPI0036600FE2
MTVQEDLLAVLADRMAIQDLIVRYAKARDTTDPEIYRQIFAPDAVIALSNGKVMSENLEEIVAKSLSDQVRFNPDRQEGVVTYALMRHDVSNMNVELSGDTARSDYYVNTLAYNDVEKRPEIIAAGRIEDDYVRREGRWWIVRSTLVIGWGNEEMGKRLQVGEHTPPQYRR